MNLETLKKYHEIFTDCWKLFKEFNNPTDDDKFWTRLKGESRRFSQKDKSSELRQALIKEINLEIYRIYKRRGDKNE